MKADAWATALLALGSVDGLKIAEKEKLAVLFIDKINDKLIKFKSNKFLNFKQNWLRFTTINSKNKYGNFYYNICSIFNYNPNYVTRCNVNE